MLRIAIRVLLGIVAVVGGIGILATLFMTYGLGRTKAQVINEVDLAAVPDGVYRGKYTVSRWANEVEVTVKDHRIVSIAMLKQTTPAWEDGAPKLFDEVIARQSLKIDTVSGATAHTKAVLKAIEDALSK